MTSLADIPETAPAERRRYDAAASRQALLDAAASLFNERGYDVTTVREIGDVAGVDPALIARYFGNKEGLYLATVAEASPTEPPHDPRGVLERVLEVTETRGLGPLGRAVVSSTLTDTMREQVSEVLALRAVRPVTETLEARGVPDAQLRAELVLAIALGVSLARSGGTLPKLRDTELRDVFEILAPLVDAVATGAA